jgi:hypothetical protein
MLLGTDSGAELTEEADSEDLLSRENMEHLPSVSVREAALRT